MEFLDYSEIINSLEKGKIVLSMMLETAEEPRASEINDLLNFYINSLNSILSLSLNEESVQEIKDEMQKCRKRIEKLQDDPTSAGKYDEFRDMVPTQKN